MNLSVSLQMAMWRMDEAMNKEVDWNGRFPAQAARWIRLSISMNSVRDHIHRTIRHPPGAKR